MYLSIDEAVLQLQNHGVVAIPTETVYGLAGLATSPKAVKKIYEVKNRPTDNPLICHFYSYDQLCEYIPHLSAAAEVLIQHFSPGPISFLFNLPENSVLKPTTAGHNTVVCRIPNHPVTLEILRKINIPLAAPSANTSTKFSPTTAKMVAQDLGSKIDGIVDGDESEIGLESTIIDCTDPHKIVILRPGVIGKLELEERLKYFDLDVVVVEKEVEENATIPGQKYEHYSPVTPIFRVKNFTDILESDNIAILGTQMSVGEAELMLKDISKIKFLNLGQNLEEIAHNLYQKLSELDSLEVEKAYLLEFNFDKSSLLEALNDKLNRVLR